MSIRYWMRKNRSQFARTPRRAVSNLFQPLQRLVSTSPYMGFWGIICAEVVALCLDSSPMNTAASRITPRSLSELLLPSQKIFDKIKKIKLI